MNLEQSISMAELKQPLPMQLGMRKSRLAVARRVFQLAAAGGHPYVNHEGPETWAKKWLKSKEFVLMEIDINAAACVHQPRHENGVRHYFQCSADAMDPIVVDGNKRKMGRTALGYVPEITVHDGKHRLKAQRMQGRTRILAWVGTKVVDKLRSRGGVEISAAAFKKFKKMASAIPMSKIAVAYELYASIVPSVGQSNTVTRQSSGEGGSRPREATQVKAGGPGSGRHPSDVAKQAGYSARNKFSKKGWAGTEFRHPDGHRLLIDPTGKWAHYPSGGAMEKGRGGSELAAHLGLTSNMKGMGGGGTAGGSSASGGSGSNPLRMGVMAKQKVKASDCQACGARSSGSLEEEDASDTKVPPDSSDTKQRVDPSDRRKFNPNKPNMFAPGTGPGYTKEFGTPNNTMPGNANGIGPRVLNKGASKSDYSRTVNAVGHEVDCMCAMCMKSKKNMDASGIKVKTINMKAPPGRENQVLELKKKYGEKSPIPFQIAWDQYQQSKD